MHTLTCSCTRTLAHAYMCTKAHAHTLTQFSKELNSQSCIDEEQQHEEKTQIPHLDSDINTHTQIYTVYETQKRETGTAYVERDANMQTDRKSPFTETAQPYCTDV